MPGANAFEDLKTWQLARGLVREVYNLTNGPSFGKDQGLRDQLRRAAVSGMANIADGFERGSKKEFIRFLYIARGSAGEVRSHLYVARDLNYIDEPGFQTIRERATELSKAVYGFIRNLENSDRGSSTSRHTVAGES
jgi:four helix bundle protein